MVYLILGDGFEEIEAITPVDVLRRCGAEVCMAGIGGLQIVGAHGIRITADCTVEQIDQSRLEMVILPGGMGGVASIQASEAALEAVRRAYADGKYVAAICAGPMVLAGLGITDGKKVTSYPGTEDRMGSAVYQDDCAVVKDGRLITSRGPGTSMAFALELARTLCGASAERTAEDMLIR